MLSTMLVFSKISETVNAWRSWISGYARFDNPKKRLRRQGVKVGDRVVWLREHPHDSQSGVVKWIGTIEGEEIAGIEFDRPLGLGSGWYRNRQLFTCEPNCGGLVAVAGLILEEDFCVNPDLSPSPSPTSPISPLSDLKEGSVNSPSPSITSSSGASTNTSFDTGIGSGGSGDHIHNNKISTYQPYVSSQSYQGRGDGNHNNNNHWSPIKPETETERDRGLFANPPRINTSSSTTVSYRPPTYSVRDQTPSPTPVSPSRSRVIYNPPHSSSNSSVIMPIPQLLPPLREEDTERINGTRRGIQGHRNSCYLDATLFSIFSFSSVFDSILLQEYRLARREDETLARDVQKILRDEVVNPLRKDLYCNANNVMKLRQAMKHLDEKLISEEMDPQEFLHLLFDKVLNLEEFMSLSSGQSDFFHQVLVQQSNEDRYKIPSIQQLFEQSLILEDLKLKGVPQPCLILLTPRSGNKYKMYEGILPNLTIDITDLLQDIPRMCIICGSLATYECPDCYGKFSSGGDPRDNGVFSPLGSGAESTAFCEMCIQQTHKRRDRQSHLQHAVPIKYNFPANQYFPAAITNGGAPSSYLFGNNSNNWGNPSFNRTPLISSIPPPSSPSPRAIPRVTMDLFAVICIETSHFVSFVKCGVDRKAPWIFFDSMADRVENANGTGQNIPHVKLLPNMGKWLDDLERQGDVEIGKRMNEDPNFPPELKRLLADPYICFYYSKESSMYC